MKYITILIVILITVTQISADQESDFVYLQDVYKDTFACIKFFTHPQTGLPYDSSTLKKETSISNIGLYAASVAIASDTGLIPRAEAIALIDKTLGSLDKIKEWHGFPVAWINVDALSQAYGPSFSYADHSGNLICGLLVVAAIFPQEFAARIDKVISKMDFAATYDSRTGWLKGGYNTLKDDFDIKQPWGEWYYNLLASDTRHFSLIGIVNKQIPEEHWFKLSRDRTPSGKLDWDMVKTIFPDKINDMPYYSPGMEGGGLFMQYLPGIFIEERKLPIGMSAKGLSRSQIEFSIKKGYYPFWGTSSCEAPDGKSYLGWGTLKENIVTPHAIVLAIENHPKEAIDALRALEKKGMRLLYKDEKGNTHDFGFTDSYDLISEKASRNYLALDQNMLFLSLANYLYNDIVRRSFDSHPIGHKVNETEDRLEKGEVSPPQSYTKTL